MAKWSITYGRGYAYSLLYHVVWGVSHKHPVLVDDICVMARQSVSDTLYKLGAIPVMVDIKPTYVHLIISCKPQIRLSDAVKVLKGNSARKIFMFNNTIKSVYHIDHLWCSTYLVFSHRDDYEQIIDDYIAQL